MATTAYGGLSFRVVWLSNIDICFNGPHGCRTDLNNKCSGFSRRFVLKPSDFRHLQATFVICSTDESSTTVGVGRHSMFYSLLAYVVPCYKLRNERTRDSCIVVKSATVCTAVLWLLDIAPGSEQKIATRGFHHKIPIIPIGHTSAWAPMDPNIPFQ